MLEKHTVFMAVLTFSEIPMLCQILPPSGEKCGLVDEVMHAQAGILRFL
jgi:hypothetical protein